MKKQYLLLHLLFIGCGLHAQVSVGATNYTTLRSAFAAINAGTHQGNVTVLITGNTTETASAVLNASGTGSANYTSVTVSPSGNAARTISGNFAGALVQLNGADNVTIDGLNSGGNSLILSNASTSSSNTSTVEVRSGASNNMLTRTTVLGSSGWSMNSATIYFADGANEGVTVSYCKIGPAGSNLPGTGIGTSTGQTGALIIRNNEIYDYHNSAGTTGALFYTIGALQVTDNVFYQTAARSFTTTSAESDAIYVAGLAGSTGNVTISGNTIGFANAAGTGLYECAFADGSYGGLRGIYAGNNGTGTFTVQNNTISGIRISGNMLNTYEHFFAFIEVSGATAVNGNTVGNMSSTGITVNSTGSTSVTGIRINQGASATGNNIGGFNVNAVATNVFGIYSTSTGALSGNIIGGNVPNSLDVTVQQGYQFFGFYLNKVGNVTGNTVRNLTYRGEVDNDSDYFGGMYAYVSSAASATTGNITNNTIYQLRTTTLGFGRMVTGISVDISNTNYGGTVINASGNRISNLYTDNPTDLSTIRGIVLNMPVGVNAATCNNNMVALAGLAPNNYVQGIVLYGFNAITVLHNSVYLSGTPTASTTYSYAFYDRAAYNSGNKIVRNNIFVNMIGMSGGTARHYIMSNYGPAGQYSNNLYYGATGRFAIDTGSNFERTSFATWQSFAGEGGSYFANPNFAAPEAAYPDLHISGTLSSLAENNGTSAATTLTDIDGETRSSLTPVDIGADAGNFFQQPVITSLSVATGCPGSTFTINGSHMAAVTAVTIGGVACTGVTATDTSVTATVGNGTTGTVTVSSPTGSASFGTFTVKAFPVFTTQPSAPAALCAGAATATIATVATNAATYQWRKNGQPLSNLDGYSNVTTASVTLTNLPYSENGAVLDLAVTSAAGCTTISNPVTLAVVPVTAITANTPAPFCQGGSAVLTASGALSYTWAPATGLSATTGATVTASPSQTTTYYVTGLLADGCTSTIPVVVTVSIPQVTFSGAAVVCHGSNTTLTASGGVSYTWSPATGLNTTTGATVIASPTTTTTYTVTATGADGCQGTGKLTVEVMEQPVITASGPVTFCADASVSLTSKIGGSLQLDGSDDYADINRNISGDFTIEFRMKTTQSVGNGTNWYEGKGLVDGEVGGNVNDFGTSLLNNKVCFGVGGGGSLSDLSIKSVSNVNTGNWVHVAVTRSQSSGQLQIYINGVLESSVVSGNHNLMTAPSKIRIGGIQAGGSHFNGSIDDVRIWNYVRSASEIAGYGTTFYDATTPGLVDYVKFNSPGSLLAPNTNTISNPAVLYNGATMTAEAYASYLWSTGETTPQITVNTSGNYSVTTTDANGCSTASAPIAINVNPLPNVTASTPNATICNGDATTLNASGALTYSWSPATGLSATTGASVTAQPTVTTTYTVTGTNANGCTQTASVTVTVNQVPLALNATQASICPGGSATLTASGALSYSWSPSTGLSSTSADTVTASPAETTTYTVAATSADGCVTSKSVTVLVDTLPVLSAGAGAALCPGASLTISAQSVSPALQFDGDDYFEIPRHVSGDFTIEFWINTTQYGAGLGFEYQNSTALISGSVASGPGGFGISLRGNGILFSFASGFNSWGFANNVATGNWVHVAAVRSGNVGLIYVNGILKSAFNTYSGTVASTDLLVIGKHGTGDPNYFNGKLDDIQIWNVARSDAQIQSDATAVQGPDTANLTNYYRLEETANTAVFNYAAAYNGTSVLHGPSWTTRPLGTFTSYNWSNGSTNPTISVSAAGNYTLTATRAGGCTVTSAPTTVTILPAPSINIAASDMVLCPGESAILTASGGISYSWPAANGLPASTGSEVTVTPSATTTYSVTGTDASGCQNTVTVTITVETPAVTLQQSGGTICQGGSTTLTASGLDTYTWSPAIGLSSTTGSTVTASPNATTTYTVTGTNANGCAATNTITVTVDPMRQPIITATGPTSICDDGSGLVMLAAGEYSAYFDGIDDYGTMQRSIAGDFTIEYWMKTFLPGNNGPQWYYGRGVVDMEVGGSVNDFGTSIVGDKLAFGIGGNGGPDLTIFSSSTVTTDDWVHVAVTRNASTGMIRMYINGVEEASAISPNTNPLTASDVIRLGALQPGNNPFRGSLSGLKFWDVVRTQAEIANNKDTHYAAAEPHLVDYFKLDEISGNTGDNTTHPENPASLANGVSHYVEPYDYASYSWSNGQTTGYCFVIPEMAGDITLTVTNANGCSATSAPITITSLAPPAITITAADPVICRGASTVLTAHGGVSYTWYGSDLSGSITGTSITVSPTSEAYYLVEGVDENGCKSSGTITVPVTQPDAFTASAGSGSICIGGSTTLSVTGSVANVSWSPADGLSATTGASVTASPTQTTTYTYTATGTGNGCPITGSLTVTVNPLPEVVVTKGTPSCSGTPLSVQQNYSDPAVFFDGVNDNITHFKAISGDDFTIEFWMKTTQAGPNGATWSDGKGLVDANFFNNSLDFGVALLGNKIAFGIGNGSTDYTLLSNSDVTTGEWVHVAATRNKATGIMKIYLNGVENASGNSQNTLNIPPSSTLLLRFGCLKTGTNFYNGYLDEIRVWETTRTPSEIANNMNGEIAMGASGLFCNYKLDEGTGAAVSDSSITPAYTVNGQGGITWGTRDRPNNYVSFLWSNGETTPSILATTAGSYTVTATNANGCTASSSGINVTNDANVPPTIGVTAPETTLCRGVSTLLTASGAETYSWSPATGLNATTGASVTATPLTTTTYTVTGTNAIGCANTSTITITVNQPQPATVLPATPAICQGSSVVLTASGGSNYSWSPATGLDTTSGAVVTASPATTTTYTVTMTDAAGCTSTKNITVTVNMPPNLGLNVPSTSICQGCNVTMTAFGATSYSWSPATGLNATTGAVVTASPSETTTYTVTGSNGNGCISTMTVTIEVFIAPTVTASATLTNVCSNESTTLTATGGATYSWSPATGLSSTTGASVTAAPSTTTTYTVTGTDAAGHTGTDTVTITVHQAPDVMAMATTPVICPGGSTSLSASGADSYSWSPATGLSSTTGAVVTASPSVTTVYTVTGTAEGCSDSFQVTVTVPDVPAVSASAPGYCQGEATVVLSIPGTIAGVALSENFNGGAPGWTITEDSSTAFTNWTYQDSPLTLVNLGETLTTPDGGKFAIANSDSGGSGSETNTTLTSPSFNTMGMVAAVLTFEHQYVRYNDDMEVRVQISTDGGSNWITLKEYTSSVPMSTETIGLQSYLNQPDVRIRFRYRAIWGYFWAIDNVRVSNPAGDQIAWAPQQGLYTDAAATQPYTGSSAAIVYAAPDATTTYTATIDRGDCVFTSDATITANALTVAGSQPSLCPGGSMQLTASGADSYSWSPAAGLTATTGDTVTAQPTITTTYTVTGYSSGCSTQQQQITVIVAVPNVAVYAGNTMLNPGESTTLTAYGADTYTWSPMDSLTVTSNNEVIATPTVSTTYTVTGTNSSGCEATASVTVLVAGTSSDIIAFPSLSICPDQTTELTARAPGDDNALLMTPEIPAYLPHPAVGDFTLEYWIRTTSNGSAAPNAAWYEGANVTTAISYSVGYGMVGTSIVNGKLAFGFVDDINPPNEIRSTSNVNTGAWTHVAVSREMATGEIRLYINGMLEATGTTTSQTVFVPDVTYVGKAFTAPGFGGGLDDVRIWDSVRTASDIQDNMSGLPGVEPGLAAYFPITEDTGAISFDLVSGQTLYTIAGKWTVRPDNGTTYLWSTGETTPSIAVSSQGDYSVAVTKGGMTYPSLPVTVTVSLPSISISASATTVCPGESVTLEASSPAMLGYNWVGGAGGPVNIVSPTETTTYTVIGTSESGCIVSTDITIIVSPGITVAAGQRVVCTGTSTTLTATGATTYTWSPADGLSATTGSTVTATPESTTTYTVSGVTADGCATSATVTVEVKDLNPTITADATSLCQGESATLTVSTDYDSPALHLNGDANFYIPSNLSDTFTVECWIRTTQTGPSGTAYQDGVGILGIANGLDLKGGISLLGSKLAFGISGDGFGPDTTLMSTSDVNTGAWVHIAATRASGSGQLRLFVNGIEEAVGVCANASVITYNNFFFGDLPSNNLPFIGDVDELRQWTVVRTQPQIASNMDDVDAASAGLFSCRKFDEGTGNDLADEIFPYTATIYGDAHWIARAPDLNYLWSNGATTREITVDEGGSYSVEVSTPACSMTSTPVTIVKDATVLAVSPSTASLCSGGSVTLTASGLSAYTWSPATGLNATTGSTVTANPTVTTVYTVSGITPMGCSISRNVTVSVTTPLVVAASATSVCTGDQAVTLSATGGTTTAYLLKENFNSGAPDWTVENEADSPDDANWKIRQVPVYWYGNLVTADGGYAAFTDSDAGGEGSRNETSLISPSFSTVGYTNATLTFQHRRPNYPEGDEFADIDISTDGGATWSLLKTYLGVASALSTANVVLPNAWLNQPDVRIRFHFASNWGYYWLIDDVRITSTVTGPTTWSPQEGLYTDALATQPYTGQDTAIVFAKPAVTTTYTAIASPQGSCAATTDVTLSAGSGTVTPDQALCAGSQPSDLTLVSYAGTIMKWQRADHPSFANATDIASTSATLQGIEIGTLNTTTYIRAVTSSASCGTAFSAYATISMGHTVWDGGSWSNGTPDAVTSASVTDDLVLNSDLSACSLTVSDDAHMTVTSGHDLYVAGAVIVMPGSELLVENAANLLQDANAVSNTNSGNIIVQRDVKLWRQDYAYWGAPVAGQLLRSFSPATLLNRFYTFDPSSGQFAPVYPPQAEANYTFEAAKGYMVRAPNTFVNPSYSQPELQQTFEGVFTGVPNNGDYTIATVNGASPFHLVSNPYPSTVDADLFLDGNEGTVYFWTHHDQIAGSSNYASYNAFGGAAAYPNGVVPNGTIQTGQGFLFYNSEGLPQVAFHNTMRTGNNAGQFFRQSNDRSRIWLDLTSNGQPGNQTLVGYTAYATAEADAALDGAFIQEGNGVSTLIGTTRYAIQARPAFDVSDVVPLGLHIVTPGTATIAIHQVDGLFEGGQDIFLKDNETGIVHDLKAAPYTFTTAAGDFDGRLQLQYADTTLGMPSPTAGNSLVIYKDEGAIHIDSGTSVMERVRIFDIRGREIYLREAIGASHTQLGDLVAEQQVLLVQVTSESGEVTTRKVAY